MGKPGYGPANPNWRGGRSVASNGYVIVRVGLRHHLADVRGYAYEHRLVAEEMLGRRLRPGEIPHHKNGNRADNSYGNIEICRSHWHHRAKHRNGVGGRRNPGEANRIVSCACGCGTKFRRFDSSGRRRRFVSGHNPHESNVVLFAVLSGAETIGSIAEATGKTRNATRVALSKLSLAGKVRRVSRGIYDGGV